MANLPNNPRGGTGASNSPVGSAGQPDPHAAMKKAIADRMSRSNQLKKGEL